MWSVACVATVGVGESTRLLKDRLDCGRIDSNKVESEWNVAHNRVDGFASSRFFDRVERGANRVDSEHNRVDFYHNRVDSCHNRVDSGAAHNTIFGSTILKQTACHTWAPHVVN